MVRTVPIPTSSYKRLMANSKWQLLKINQTFFEGIKIQQFGAIRFGAPVTAAADQIRLGHRTEFLDLGEQIGASEHGGLANGGRLPPQLTAAKLPSPIRWEA